MPDARARGRETEIGRTDDMGQCPVRIILDVGGETEHRAGLQHARQFAQRLWRDEAALVVARFRPGVWIEQIGRIEARGRQLDEELQRVVGLHPDDNEPITTNFGRFGPYVKHGDEFRSLESEDDVFNISFDAALELLRAPKQSRRRQGAQKKTLRELTHDGTTIKLLAGRYGPYVTDGRTNASIPKTTNPDELTYAQAEELLAARRGAAPTPRRSGGRSRRAGASTKSRGSSRKAAEA